MDLALLVNKFDITGRLVTIVSFGNGNINDTFLAVFRNTFSETQVVLQRVNKAVFPQPELIMRNMHNITHHCHEKLEADAAAGRDDRVWQMTRIIKTKDGADFVVDDKGDVWRVITRILSAPGLWLQRLTTKEPDDEMLEVAIRALEMVLPEEQGADRI